MKLGDLVSIVPPVKCTADHALDIRGVTSFSGEVKEGFVFFALPGRNNHGIKFTGEALEKGAAVVVSDRDCPEADLVYTDPFAAMSAFSAALSAWPALSMNLTGITGTNGKTTVSRIVYAILCSIGPAGIVGTQGFRYNGSSGRFSMTTPQAWELQPLLRRMLDSGVSNAVMEVSSHALELKRVADLWFEGVIFTNLTRDHLDFHGSLENYYRSKLRIFDLLRDEALSRVVINTDDDYGRRMIRDKKLDAVTYGLGPEADFRASVKKLGIKGSSFKLVTPYGSRDMNVRLVGRFNIYNCLAALAWAIRKENQMESICRVVEEVSPVPGRLELVSREGEDNRVVVIDYAHTPDALENVLLTLKEAAPRRLICVFGCGGDRDRTKRPVMGKIAGLIADTVYLTSDNPRSEDPVGILLDIELGLRQTSTPYLVISDREEAIMAALRDARPGDCVLIAGKGDEEYQIVGDEKIPFSDRRVARKYL